MSSAVTKHLAFPVILSAPSGGGKTTIRKELLRLRSDVGYSVSATTRPPRPAEVDGRDYYFLSREEFETRRERGDFAEWAEVHGNWYGTLRSEIRRVLDSGRHVIMDIDVQGARQFVQCFPDTVLIFLLPPAASVLLSRLQDRMTESRSNLVVRLQTARRELEELVLYQYVVVNDDLSQAVAQVSAILDAEGVRQTRVSGLMDRVAALVAGIDKEITQLEGAEHASLYTR